MDLCIVADFTGSMKHYLDALKPSMLEFIHIFKLCNDIDRISVLGYSDYCEREVIKWSGWKSNAKDLVPFVNGLQASGGQDLPEAAKSAAFELTKKVEKKTLVIWYTDAPPHTNFTGSQGGNMEKEQRALGDNFDWVTLCTMLASLNSSVWVLLPHDTSHNNQAIYSYMSNVTGGKTLLLSVNSNIIGTTTVGLVLAVMGHKYEFHNTSECYITNHNDQINNENDINNILIQNNRDRIQSRPVEMQFSGDAGKNLMRKFTYDSEYKDIVYKVFEDILTPQLIKSLTYNPLFGALWRAICRDRNDERRDTLVNKLSNLISSITGTDKVVMQVFIEESYNQSGQIEELIDACGDKKFPAVILEKDIGVAKLETKGRVGKFTSKDILEITRSCSPSSLRQLCEILTGLKIVDDINITNQKFIPIALKNNEFFACLPHLVVDGVMFSFRASVVMAMLVIYTGTEPLLDKAWQFVLDSRGKWLVKDQAENFSYEFIKFALRVDDKMCSDCLTDSERNTFKNLHTIGGLKINANTTLNLKLPFTSCKTTRPDYKFKCSKCNEMRSFTILNEDNVCGLCLCDPTIEYQSVSDTHSYWCECRTCKVHYAVEDVGKLNVEPKCHFCRNQIAAPSITCTTCRNNFVCCMDNPEFNDRNKSCPICVDSQPSDQEIEVSVKNYLKGGDTIFASKSVWSIYEDMKFKPTIPNIVYPTKYNGKQVLNVNDLKSNVDNWIVLEKAEIGVCMICFNEMNKHKLYDVCDLKNCNTKACLDCLTHWYGEPKPGNILPIGNLKCTFCRKPPTSRILKKYNKELCTLKTFDHKTVDNNWHYAWCIKCYKGKKYVEKECAEDAPEVSHFVCEDCTEVGKDILCKTCPHCGVMVEKSSGCDHITCSCGSHWCYACNELSTKDKIYDHMWSVLGNIGLVDNNDNYDYDNETGSDDE